jgi:hypothetical protein
MTTWARSPPGRTEEQMGYSVVMSCLVRPAISLARVINEA